MRRAARLLGLGCLLASTGCLEGFERLVTRISYDPFSQTFRVERRLVGITARFLGCEEDPLTCGDALRRVTALVPPELSTSPSDTLLVRLLDSGAVDPRVEVAVEGDRVDLVVRYDAPVASRAAEDTLVHAEFEGRSGHPGGRYVLVVDGTASGTPPDGRYTTRRVAQPAADGLEWREMWVLPPRRREVTTLLEVGADVIPLLQTAPALRAQLGEVAPPAPPVPPPPPEPKREPKPAKAEAPPEVGAEVLPYEPRVRGAADAALLASTLEALRPQLDRCWELSLREDPDRSGYAFLFARVGEDGRVASTSVYGTLSDPTLFSCLGDAFAAWTPPAGGPYEVEFPLSLRPDAKAR